MLLNMIQSTPPGLALSIPLQRFFFRQCWLNAVTEFVLEKRKKGKRRNLACLKQRECACTVWTACVHVCGIYSRLRISTDTQDMTSNHDKLVLYRCTKLFNLTVRGEKEGVWGINRCLCVLWRVQAQQEKMEQGRGGRVGWGYRCTALSNNNGENQRKEMPCTISQDIDPFSPGTPGNCM